MTKDTVARGLIRIGAALTLLLSFGVAQAVTYTVTTTCDDTPPVSCDGETLRDAINAADTDGITTGDTIDFRVSGTITLGSPLPGISTNLLTIDGTGRRITISGGTTSSYGGALFVNFLTTLNLNALTFSDNSAPTNETGLGGAIYNAGLLTVTNSKFSGNNAFSGGAIYNFLTGTLSVADSTFSGDNYATEGGAIYSESTLSITNSIFSGNNADLGGAIISDAALTVTDSTFSGNGALDGGAILTNAGPLIVANSTFSGNAAYSGGAIVGAGTFTNSTFSGNTSEELGGGGSIIAFGTVTLINTIFAGGGTNGNCNNPSVGGNAITDGGGNLSDDDSCGFSAGTSLNNVPDLGRGGLHLGKLKRNGGPTPTIALHTGSIAINWGLDSVCSAPLGPPDYGAGGLDQLGQPRPTSGSCSSGAYQYEAGAVP